jgi:MtrB/PioB family decaheme-associated outer membrane protein
MNRKLIPILVGSLFAATAAWAADEDEFSWNGSSIGFGLRGTNQEGGTRNGAYGTSATTTAPFTGPEDKAKMNEYRDLSNGFIGNIDLIGSSNRNYLRFFGENFNLDDEYLNLRGGSYGNYKYQLFEDKMPHNLSWGALTPLSPVGGTVQTGPGAVPTATAPGTPVYPPYQNPTGWNQFDYKLQRNVIGGNAEFTFNSPWHVRIGYNETTMQGVRPGGGRLGTGSGNGAIELGVPTDYKTKDATVDFGYSTKKWSVSANLLNSRFNNNVEMFQWTNFYMLNNLDTTYLPPDNNLNRLGLNGTVRDLPWNSTLAARATWTKLTNNFGVASSGLMPTNNASPPTGVGYLNTPSSSDSFNGDIDTKSASLSWAFAPGAGVDFKPFANYYDSKNKSSLITYGNGFLGTGPCPAVNYASSATATQFCIGPYPNSLFSYKKVELGIDAGWRLNRANKVSGGYTYLDTNREGRDDADKTRENKLWAEYKNSTLENLSGRLKVQYLKRHSELDPSEPVGQNPFTAPATPNQVPYYFRAYDVSDMYQPMLKLVLDWTPMPLLDTGFETAWKKTYYQDLYYGRTGDERQEYNLTVSYGEAKRFRVTGLVNYEFVDFNQAYHNGTTAQPPVPGNPQPQTATDFDWGTKNKQTNRLFGLIAEGAPTERLALKLSYLWTKTGGGVSFWSGNTAGAGGFNGGPLINYQTDNTKKQTLSLTGNYKIDKSWTGTAGYTREKYDYWDAQMNGYQGYTPYYQNLGGTNNSWFSGAFANPSYKLDVVYLMATYKF